MKYNVTATSFQRVGTNGYRYNDYVRDEIIDTETNRIFESCLDAFEVEDRYEMFWNRMNDNYENHEIVKVLKVVPVENELFAVPTLVA